MLTEFAPYKVLKMTKCNSSIHDNGITDIDSNMNKSNLKIGDPVRVREGTVCPDMKDLCIGRWQGRVSEITEDKDGKALICVQWDSVTLLRFLRHELMRIDNLLCINKKAICTKDN